MPRRLSTRPALSVRADVSQFTIAQTYSGIKSGHTIPDDHHWHMIHCIDYMREAILCGADMALEGHETTFPDDNGGSDGWDSKHGRRLSSPPLTA